MRPLLSFAWERHWEEETKLLIQTAKKAIENTQVLVIIGYSIPFFNREVDRDIFSIISHTTKKIFIQDCDPHSVFEKLGSIWIGDLPKVELKDKVEQFYLPPEL
jgi:hypothetical protein